MLRTGIQERIQERFQGGRRAPAHRFIAIVMLSFATLLAIAGCGPLALPGSTSTGPAATPTAQQIVTRAQSARLTDATFTLTLDGESDGTSVKATGNGKATTNPARVSLSLSMEASGVTIALDEIIDSATNTSYTRITSPDILASKTWVKNADSSSGVSGSDMQVVPPYSKLKDVKLVGAEQLNGVGVWHLKATIPAEGTTSSGDVDIYLRQADYLPAQMVIHTSGDSAAAATVVYTAVNTGVKIDLPNV